MRLVFLCLAVVFACGHASPSKGRQEFFCYHCDDASENSECTAVAKCPLGHNTCLTQMLFTDQGLMIQKRCAKQQTCYNYVESSPEGCANPDDEFEGFCSYCCDTPGCNADLPSYPITGTVQVKTAEDENSHDSHDSSGHKHGLLGLLGSHSLLNLFGPHGFGSKPTHNGGKSGSKPAHLTSGGKSGSKPGPQKGSGGKSGSKPGPAQHGPGGKSGSKPGPAQHGPGGKSGSKPGPGGKSGPAHHSHPTSPPSTHAPTHATNPPQTYAPVNTGGNSLSCHCHAGQPCYQNHGQNNIQVSTGNQAVSLSGSGLDINIHIGGLIFGNAGTCPCAQQKQPGAFAANLPTTSPKKTTAKPTTTVLPVTKKALATNPPTQPTTTTAAPTQPPTTAAPTQPPTTPTTTTTTTTIPTTTVKHTQCYSCKDLSCHDMNLISCPSDNYYCMNTISQSSTGQRNFTKGCVQQNACHNDWWLHTAGLPNCFLLDNSPSGPPGMPLPKCSFCCQGDGCNKDAIPSATSLYNPKNASPTAGTLTTVKPKVHIATTLPSTTPTPPTTKPSTTMKTSPTTTVAPTHAPTTTPVKTTTQVQTPALKCSVCGDLNSNIPCTPLETVISPQKSCKPNEFCMTDLVYDQFGTQTVYKRCVSHTTCVKKWYHETSDLAICTQSSIFNPPPNLECHYCCHKDNCNNGLLPDQSTLYIPKGQQ